MNPAILALLSVICYAVSNVIFDQKLSKYSSAGLLFCLYLIPLSLVSLWLIRLKLTHQSPLIPSGKIFLLVLIVGFILFLADIFFVTSYTTGGNFLVVTTVMTMLPVLAATIKYFWKGGTPNFYQVGGYALAIVAIILVVKGSKGD